MRVTGDLSFSGSFLAAFSLEAWVFSRVLRLLRPKHTLMNVIVFMPFKVDARCIHTIFERLRCLLVLQGFPEFQWNRM
jgi:hypothetical protein